VLHLDERKVAGARENSEIHSVDFIAGFRNIGTAIGFTQHTPVCSNESPGAETRSNT